MDAGQFRLHVRAPAGTRIEETERIFGQVEDAIRAVVPDSERAMILDNIGLTQSFTIMAYVDNGTVSDGDGEILVSLKPKHRPTADTSPACATSCRGGSRTAPSSSSRPTSPARS